MRGAARSRPTRRRYHHQHHHHGRQRQPRRLRRCRRAWEEQEEEDSTRKESPEGPFFLWEGVSGSTCDDKFRRYINKEERGRQAGRRRRAEGGDKAGR